MRRTATLVALAAFVAVAIPAPAKIFILPLHQQYKAADAVVRARFHAGHPVRFSESVEYSVWEFEVLETFKGGVRALQVPEKKNRIAVAGQSEHDFDCPVPPAFEAGREYVLFLVEARSMYLYQLVTDMQGQIEATDAALRRIRDLQGTRGQEQAGFHKSLAECLVRCEREGDGVRFASDGFYGVQHGDRWETAFARGVGGSFLRRLDDHAHASLTVVRIEEDGVVLDYESTFDHRSFGPDRVTVDRGTVKIAWK